MLGYGTFAHVTFAQAPAAQEAAEGAEILVPAANIVVAVSAPSIRTGASVSVPDAEIVVTANAPRIATGARVAVPDAVITVAGSAPAINTGASVSVPAVGVVVAAIPPAIEVEAGFIHPSHDKLPPTRKKGVRGRTPQSVYEELRKAEEDRRVQERDEAKQKRARKKPVPVAGLTEFDRAAIGRIEETTKIAATKAVAVILEDQRRQAAESEQERIRIEESIAKARDEEDALIVLLLAA
jgi:hypothetical protein